MSDLEQMPMEPEVQDNFFLQILQDMEKVDFMWSSLGVLTVMIMAVISLAIYYSNKIKKTGRR